MGNLFNHLRACIFQAMPTQYTHGLTEEQIIVERPKDPKHGDVATNIAMILAKSHGISPRQAAEEIAVNLRSNPLIKAVDIAGPGFINLVTNEPLWQQEVANIIDAGADYGASNLGAQELVNVEFVSANPTGPMHIGHARGAIYGDALCRLLSKCGYKVIREYYMNDAGGQIDTLAESLFVRYQQALGKEAELGEGMYPGDYLIEAAQTLQSRYGDSLLTIPTEERRQLLKEFAVSEMMKLIKADLKSLGVEHEIFTSEYHDIRQLGKIDAALAFMKAKGFLYQGVLEAPKGKTPDDWEPREQTLFKATEFGDDVDRPVRKSNNDFTYFAADIAYHKDKLDRGFNKMILLLGADHSGYIKRMKAAVRALSSNNPAVQLEVKINQLVNFFKNGVPFKMSKRSGNFLTVGDVIEEVGKDILRFVMLTRKNDTVLDFDLDKVKEQSKDNPVFYVQYAHARAYSVLRNAQKVIATDNVSLKAANFALLTTEDELNLIKKLAWYPKMLESAALAAEPHRITYYLEDLANEFHSLWSKGNTDASLRFLLEDNLELSKARVGLLKAAATVIASGLEVLGVVAVESM
jgi:arginyl-tRNA synthetase